ncbi:MAG TPA: hypothetical protein VFU15_15655, partial [Bacteroidia bacterium]|nr:hypothetical protein [Bacteroidia bacterium]
LLVAAHYLAGVKYPIQRMGLYIFVLMMFALVAVLPQLLPQRSATVAGICIALPVVFHFAYCANFSYLCEWKACAGAQRAAEEIMQRCKDIPAGRQVRVCGDGYSGSAIEFVAERDYPGRMNVFINWSEDQPAQYDFYLIEKWAIPSFDQSQWIAIDTMPYSENVLFMDSSFVRQEKK